MDVVVAVVAVSYDTFLTDGAAESARALRFIGSSLLVFLYKHLTPTPLDGARTSLFAATHPDVKSNRELYGGAYLVPFGKIGSVSPEAKDVQLAENLWRTSEEIAEELLSS